MNFALGLVLVLIGAWLILHNVPKSNPDGYTPMYSTFWRGSADYAIEMSGHREAGFQRAVKLLQEIGQREAADLLLQKDGNYRP